MENVGNQGDGEAVRIRSERDTGAEESVSVRAVVEAAKVYRRALQNTKMEWTLAKLGDGSDRVAVREAVNELIDAQQRLFAALDSLPSS